MKVPITRSFQFSSRDDVYADFCQNITFQEVVSFLKYFKKKTLRNDTAYTWPKLSTSLQQAV